MKTPMNTQNTQEWKVKHWGKTVPLNQVQIPDLWEIAHLPELKGYSLGGKSARDLIIECWHLAHDFKKQLENHT